MGSANAIVNTAAGDAAAAAPGFGLNSIVLIVLFIGVFYFIAIRPQSKQVNEKRAMLSDIRPGDDVVTIGGIHGVVVQVNEDEDDDEAIVLRVAPEVEIKFLKAAVQNITNRDWREGFPQFQKKGMFVRKGDKR
ncbi:MAG: preprotein translocase subunit YajC [Gracilibacteraceae bacterium]|jgi:preprotein translocase subunit YajC|nr:preprotein translocase subunit YajC [Gracilibacteraceae bacterium]